MKKSDILRSIKIMIDTFGSKDPRRGCWEYICKHHPVLWSEHQAAMREIADAYQAKDAGRVMAAKIMAFDTFNSMIEKWTSASEQMPLVTQN